ncbi:unnamed protein product [Mytilus edulis]|uniref:Reverse transcriptase domain-containing protein n=1 Tax=Mytilus edulis TaxID=6550 RepID=A0A8S3RHC7_MYTED|nr:unnamed protein product [Mytilus edulis]
MAISTTEAIYSTHQNVSVGRFKNTSMCGVFALTQDEKTFHISSDAHLIDPPCSLYLIGVNIINNNYSLSGMCYKMSDIALPCGRNDTLILREWDLDIGHKDQSILLYANQSMLVTEKTLRCDSNQDFTMNYEFCRKELSMIEILFYSPNNPSSVLPKITVQSRVLIGPTYPPLSLYDMETMKIQMDECKTCKVTAHQMYIDFLDRVILIANNNNKNNKNEDKNEEETSSASVDLNILLPSLFGSIATVAVAVVAAYQAKDKCCSNGADKQPPSKDEDSVKQQALTPEEQAENGNANSDISTDVNEDVISLNGILIYLILFADDTVLFGKTPTVLQHLFDKLLLYCNKWNIEVNADKTKVVVFRNGFRPVDTHFFYDNKELQVVNSYVYLGVLLHYNGKFLHTQKRLAQQGSRAMSSLMNSLKQFFITPEEQMFLFDKQLVTKRHKRHRRCQYELGKRQTTNYFSINECKDSTNYRLIIPSDKDTDEKCAVLS